MNTEYTTKTCSKCRVTKPTSEFSRATRNKDGLNGLCRQCNSVDRRTRYVSHPRLPFVERFWSRIDKNGPIPEHCPELGPCWIWTAGKTYSGYGNMPRNGKHERAYRVAWELTNGPIPEALKVLHRCDNPPCCNPNHLFLGTQLENIRDQDRKGRQAHLAGEANGFHKLTWDKVRFIRIEYAKGGITAVELAKQANVSPSTIRLVLANKTWKE